MKRRWVWWLWLAVTTLLGIAGGKRSYRDEEDEDEDLTLVIHMVPHSVIPRWTETENNLYEATVSNVLTKVIDQLDNNVNRRFVWAETLFFRRWYDGLNQGDKERVRRAVKDGQLEFVGGGVVEHDEAAATWEATVEQISLGNEWLRQRFGVSPSVAWQVGGAGHSDATPSILSLLGYDALVIDKVHYRVKQQFKSDKHLEFVWRGSDLQDGASSSKPSEGWQFGDVFTHILYQGYSAPEGFDFESGKGVRQVTNAKRRADRLVHSLRERATSYRTHHLLVPFGDDLRFVDADKQFTNIEKLMRYINEKMTDVKIRFSTASEYLKAVRETAAVTGLEFPRYIGDFYPYADSKDGYWSGLYSTRQSLKAACRDMEDLVRSSELFFAFARAKATALGDAPPIKAVTNGHVDADNTVPPPAWGKDLFESLESARWTTAQLSHIHAITGAAVVQVVNDYISKLQSIQSSASSVLQASLAQLITKRESDFKASGPRVRPILTPIPFNLADELASDETQITAGSVHHPIIVYNQDTVERFKPVHVYLGEDWSSLRYIQVVDAAGNPIRAQLYHQLSLVRSKSGGSSGGGNKRRKKGGNRGGDDRVDGGKSWSSKIFLSFIAKVPPLGYTTYFCFTTSARERIKQSHLANAATPTTQLLIKVKKSKKTGAAKAGNSGNDDDEGDAYGDVQNDPSSLGFNNQQQQQRQRPSANSGKRVRGGGDSMEQDASKRDEGSGDGIETVETSDKSIELENDFLLISLSTRSGLLLSITDKRTKRKTLLRQQFWNYPGVKSGTFIFNPGNPEKIEMGSKESVVALTKGPLFEQVQVLGPTGVGQVVRLWKAAKPGQKLPEIDDENILDDIQAFVEVNHVAAPEVGMDTVVRYETNMDTEGTFYTDNMLGQLVKRTSHRDVSLSSSVFPASSTVALKDTQATEVTRMGQILAVVSKTPFGCASPFGEGSSGTIEVMIHRNHEMDDGRGVGEGLSDYSISQFSTLLAVDTPGGMLGRLPQLVSRVQRPGIPIFAAENHEYSQVFSRENWSSRFYTEQSFLRSPLPPHMWLQSVRVQDAFSDEVLVRFYRQPYGGSNKAESSQVDFGKVFDGTHKVLSSRECSASGGPALSKRIGTLFRSSSAASAHSSFSYVSHPLGSASFSGVAASVSDNTLVVPPSAIRSSLVNLVVLSDGDIPVSLYDRGSNADSASSSNAVSSSQNGKPNRGGLRPEPGKTKGSDVDSRSGGNTFDSNVDSDGQNSGGSGTTTTTSGKTKEELQSEAEEFKSQVEVLQRRVDKHKDHIDQLLQEIEKFDKQGKKHLKDATVEDLKSTEIDLEKSKAELESNKKSLQDVVRQIQSIDHTFSAEAYVFQEEARIREFEATVHGAFAGAAAMLLLVLAGNWIFSGGLKLARGYVPISVNCGPDQELPTHKAK